MSNESQETRVVKAGQAVVVAVRNYRDSETLAEALHVATEDLDRAELSALVTYLAVTLRRAIADSVWRAAHDAEAGCEWDGRDEEGGQQWLPRV